MELSLTRSTLNQSQDWPDNRGYPMTYIAGVQLERQMSHYILYAFAVVFEFLGFGIRELR